MRKWFEKIPKLDAMGEQEKDKDGQPAWEADRVGKPFYRMCQWMKEMCDVADQHWKDEMAKIHDAERLYTRGKAWHHGKLPPSRPAPMPTGFPARKRLTTPSQSFGRR